MVREERGDFRIIRYISQESAHGVQASIALERHDLVSVSYYRATGNDCFLGCQRM